MDIDLCRSMYKSYTEVNGRAFPMMIGKSVRWESWALVNLPSRTRVGGKLSCRIGVSFSRFTGKRQASERGVRDARDVGRRRKERKVPFSVVLIFRSTPARSSQFESV